MTSENNATPKTLRRLRPRIVGVVTEDKVNKTRKVVFEYLSRHAMYNKYVKRKTVLHVHDEKNESHIGDHVEVMQCRPYSKTKSYRLVRIITRGPQIDLSAIKGEASQMFEKHKEQENAAAPLGQV
ncbi:MAG: 30S ribosomal protein S17 [Planctomycetia bacterium]|jgi:small subunit ribosomal protein S17|nr:30S ribosomal protein S17 [Planctomycetia bacterium]